MILAMHVTAADTDTPTYVYRSFRGGRGGTLRKTYISYEPISCQWVAKSYDRLTEAHVKAFKSLAEARFCAEHWCTEGVP